MKKPIFNVIDYDKPIFGKYERGFTVKAFYQKDNDNALVKVSRNHKVIREFEFPAHKIWDISAHLTDIINEELSKSKDPESCTGCKWLIEHFWSRTKCQCNNVNSPHWNMTVDKGCFKKEEK